jgi:hypothetical protein
MPTFDSELFARNGATLISACNSQDYGLRYEVSFDLDSNGLQNLQSALNGLDHKDDMTEIKAEIITMHNVYNTPGDTLHEKIDNYCDSKNNVTCTCGRYKIKHR